MPRISLNGFVYVLKSDTMVAWGQRTLSHLTGQPLGPYLWKIGKAEDVDTRLARLRGDHYAGCGDWTLAHFPPVALGWPEEAEGYIHAWIEKKTAQPGEGPERWEWIDPRKYGLCSSDGSLSTEIFKAPLPAVIHYLNRAARTGFQRAAEEE